MVVKGNLKKKYELLKADHEKLMKEAIVAGNLIAYLKSKIIKYETVLEADEHTKEATLIQQENTINKYRQLVDTKDRIINDKEEKINKIVDKLVHTYGLEETEKLVNDIIQ